MEQSSHPPLAAEERAALRTARSFARNDVSSGSAEITGGDRDWYKPEYKKTHRHWKNKSRQQSNPIKIRSLTHLKSLPTRTILLAGWGENVGTYRLIIRCSFAGALGETVVPA